MNFFKNKTFLLITTLCFISIVLIIIGILSLQTKSPPSQSSNTTITNISISPKYAYGVIKVIPDSSSSLLLNQQQQFTISFTSDVSTGLFDIALFRKDLTKDNAFEPVQARITRAADRKSLVITSLDTIKSYSEYELRVTDRSTNVLLIKKGYLTDVPSPSSLPNNLGLVPYLPYETSTFKLSYLKDTNIYVFNFKYNSDSQETLEIQYQKARAEATKFIQSKGVNINTIVIEWRYS